MKGTDYDPQFLDTIINSSSGSPEMKLIRAVLVRAILDVSAPFKITRKSTLQRELHTARKHALAWINSPSEHPWSFLWIIEALGFNLSNFEKKHLQLKISSASKKDLNIFKTKF